MRIWITGCARSGTTLLRRLFYAFEGVEIINREISLEGLIAYEKDADVLVGKRNKWSLLSYDLERGAEDRALDLVAEYNVQIVNILRDGRDVIETQTDATPERWVASMDAYCRLRDYVALTVFYEQLVTQPDAVQALIADRFVLNPTARFSEYPSFVPEAGFQEVPRYEPRSIDTARVGKDYDWRPLVEPELQDDFEAACKRYEGMI